MLVKRYLWMVGLAFVLTACDGNRSAALSASPTPSSDPTTAAATAEPPSTPRLPSGATSSPTALDTDYDFAASRCADLNLSYVIAGVGRATVAAAYETTVDAYEGWHDRFLGATGGQSGELGPGTELLPGASSGDRIVICYYDGDIGPPRVETSRGDYTRAVVVMYGATEADAIGLGWPDLFPIIDPATASATPTGQPGN